MALHHSSSWKKLVGILYLAVLAYLLFLAPFRHNTHTTINLIPFNSYSEFSKMLRPSSFWYWFANIPGNVIAFFPLPIIFYWLKSKKPSVLLSLSFAFLIPVFIETSQFIFRVGKTNIDDVLLNATGYLLGAFTLNYLIKKSSV